MKIYGLIGRSLGHSFSKDYFTKKFIQQQIDASYENYEFEDISRVRTSLEQIAGLNGLNVTIPYKTAIIPYLDELDEAARSIAAVNTILIKEGKWIGFNTDHYGFSTSLKPFLTNKHERALVLGKGGASKAIQYALKKMGIPFNVVSRTKGETALSYEALNAHVIRACKLIINTTPLGMYPDVNTFPPLPYEAINEEHLLYDLVYNPEKSLFLKMGEERGASVMNGLDMLKLQAEGSWKIWNEK